VNGQPVVIQSPLKGEWAIFNPPGHPPLAYDFLAVNPDKSPYFSGGLWSNLFSFRSVDNARAWAQTLFSPVEGRVIAAVNHRPDQLRINMVYNFLRIMVNKPRIEEGFEAFGGNYLIIRSNQIFVLMAHLKQGSVRVAVGDTIKQGAPLGEVGNSGASLQPHLHLQVMNSENPFPLFKNLIPFKFSAGKRKVEGQWKQEEGLTLNNGGHYFFD
jgi:hypothetical protein